MSAPVLTLQFVDSIASSPTTLFDLNDRSLTFVTQDGWSAPPPALQRAISASSAQDGSRVAQSSYTDREITVTVGIKSADQDASAAAIQAIGRLLNSDGQWLKLSTGTTNPVFFRTKRAEIEQIAEFNGQSDGFRTATLTIPAEPFAYGLPESGSATIANDPTAGTNPMSYVFPTVKGDVATPLFLGFPESATTISQPVLVTNATPASLSAPFWFDAQAGSLPGGGSGWTLTDPTDSAWIGSKKRRGVKASGTTEALFMDTTTVSVPAGDYRVFMRALTTAQSTVTIYDNIGGSLVSGDVPVESGARWFDHGIGRFPAHSPQSSDPFGLVPATSAGVNVKVAMTGNGTFDLDGFLLVPVGLDGPGSTTFTSVLTNNGRPTSASLRIDGVNGQVSLLGTTGPPYDTTGVSVTVAGSGSPTIIPGMANRIHSIRRTHSPTSTVNDDIAITTALSWTYYPRYLYVRPATT